MDRLTTDTPQTNFKTMLNMVYGKDGWGYIRHGWEDMKITDFCLDLCRERGCEFAEEYLREADDAKKDESLFECLFNCCPIASVYAALCGYCHCRSRLKMYEDAGMMPPIDVLEDKRDDDT